MAIPSQPKTVFKVYFYPNCQEKQARSCGDDATIGLVFLDAQRVPKTLSRLNRIKAPGMPGSRTTGGKVSKREAR